jgi:hypothetical protein
MQKQTLVLVALLGGCAPVSDFDSAATVTTGNGSVSVGGSTGGTTINWGPRYNEVFQKATHNSYYVPYHDGGGWDANASGTEERILDQLLHEHVRSFEFDLHRDGSQTGHFTVYHTSEPDNSSCYDLERCLQLFRRFDYLEPTHGVVTLVFETKEINGLPSTARLFESGWKPDDLDRTLWSELGPRLYTPAEFMARCPTATTLDQCVAQKGWPTLTELQGRYIATIQGNWSNNYWDWYDYAQYDMRMRAAFPMRGIFRDEFPSATDPAARIEINMDSQKWNAGLPNPNVTDPQFLSGLARARANSIFWQMEAWTYWVIGAANNQHAIDFVNGGGIVRTFDTTYGDKLTQAAAARQGFNLLMTDEPFSWFFDASTTDLPTDPSKPFWKFDLTNITWAPITEESGARLYQHGTANGALAIIHTPLEAWDVWETQPSSTRTAWGGLTPKAVKGPGCLYFASSDATRAFSVCREVVNTAPNLAGYTDSEDVRIRIWQRHGSSTSTNDYMVTHNAPQPTDFGDLVRVTMNRVGGHSKAQVWGASVTDASGQPTFDTIGSLMDFDADLETQGLYTTADTLYVGTRHNGKRLGRSDFSWVTPNADGTDSLVDLTSCSSLDCGASWTLPLGHEELKTDYKGFNYVSVNRSNGDWSGQPRHLYTTDKYESTSGGAVEDKHAYFWLSRDAGRANVAPLYRCNDWRPQYKNDWLTNDPSCPGAGPGANMGVIGYVSTVALPGLVPLYQLNNGMDQLDTISDTERGDLTTPGFGYSYVGQLGWVWPLTAIPATAPVISHPGIPISITTIQ